MFTAGLASGLAYNKGQISRVGQESNASAMSGATRQLGQAAQQSSKKF